MAKQLSPVEKAKLKKIMADPVLWAKAFLVSNDAAKKKYGPWAARDYQAKMLRDKSPRKVYRCGRRCIPGWARILDPDTGERVPVEELMKRGSRMSVVTMTGDYMIKAQDGCEIFQNGEKEVFRVILRNGGQVDATDNHPLFTASGWKEIKDLKPGDMIAVPGRLEFFGEKELDDSLVKLMAYMIGDGNCKNGNLRFSKPAGKQVDEMKEIVKDFGCEMVRYESSGNPYDYGIVKIENKHNRFFKNGVREALEQYGIYGKGADDKTIPDAIFTLAERQAALFLSRLYGTDGWACSRWKETKTQYEVGYASNSEELVRGIFHLLLRFGIRSAVRRKTEKAWEVVIRDKPNLLRFAAKIGIYGKEEALGRAVEAAMHSSDIDTFMPQEINSEISAAMSEQGVSKSELVRLWDPAHRSNSRLRLDQYKLQKWKAKMIADHLGLGDLSALAGSGIEWEEIVAIEPLGTHMTYDVTVPGTHSFVVDDVITHNTGKTEVMIVEGLFEAFTHKNFRVLYITPYENQVNLIFMRMRELIHDSPLVKREIVRMKNSPYMIELMNGSCLMGFTTGASSGQGAASVRGQKADLLLLDELDYMAEMDYSTVAMIAGERPDIRVVSSSTPTGKRGTFWKMCTDPAMGYKEFYFPSMANPNWSKEMEDQFRAELTDSQYQHEVLAEFGTEESGVFSKDRLDEAMRMDWYAYDRLTDAQMRSIPEGQAPKIYDYSISHPAPFNEFRAVGIDWDKIVMKKFFTFVNNISLSRRTDTFGQ